MEKERKTRKKSLRLNENYVFIQAYQLYQKAQSEEDKNFIIALNYYKQAVSLIESIPEKFPASQLAIKIAQRKVRLGTDSFKSLKKKIATLRIKAQKEELLTILHDCALNLIDPSLRAEKLSELALLFQKNAQSHRAIEVFNEASIAIDEIEGNIQKNSALNKLAIKYAQVDEFERALTLSAFFTELSDQIRLLTDLGFAYFESRHRERAIQLFHNALELVERSGTSMEKDANTAWVSYKLADSQEFFWAIEVCETIEDESTRVATLSQIAAKLISIGQLGNIQELVDRVDQPRVKAELIASLVSKYSSEGYFSQARELAEKINVLPFKSRAFLAIAKDYKGKQLGQMAKDLVEEAIELIEETSDEFEKILVITSAALLCRKFKNDDRAKELIKICTTKSEKLSDEKLRDESLNYIFKACLQMDFMEQANIILEKQAPGSYREDSVIEKANKLAEMDKFAEAVKTLNEVHDVFTRLKACLSLVEHNPGNRNFKRKTDLITGVMKISESLENTWERDFVLSKSSVIMATLERFHNSLQALEKIESAETRDQLLLDLAQIKYNSDFFTEGIEIMRLISSPDKKIVGLIDVGIDILNEKYPDSTFKPGDFLPIAFSFWLEEKEKIDFN
jgi:tetratricopeptide (TPR) repeat protein